GIGRQKSAAVSGLDAGMAQERPHFSYLLKQFASGYTQKLLAANLPQHDAVICPVQLREKTFKKICHERSVSRGQRARRRVITFQEVKQVLAERRQVVFPGKDPAADGEARILAMHGVFE